MSISQRISRFLARQTHQRMLPLRGAQGVISFTFDDAPASACTTGAALLEKHGARGTFYIAGSLTDKQEQGHLCHSRQQLERLIANGHEIGCHGFSHVRYDAMPEKALNEDLDKNLQFLRQLGVDTGKLDFAYPFGAYSLPAKKTCLQRFQSARITGGGLHTDHADLYALHSYRLYHGEETLTGDSDFATLAGQAGKDKGWLIVNTHDVSDTPSPWGYTPANLEKAILAAIAAGCLVLPVNEAITYWEQQAS